MLLSKVTKETIVLQQDCFRWRRNKALVIGYSVQESTKVKMRRREVQVRRKDILVSSG